MSDAPEESEVRELLHAAGMVAAPERRVLEGAREVLWSAIASEMLGIGPPGDQGRHRRTRRGQRSQPQDQRKRSMGGGGPDS